MPSDSVLSSPKSKRLLGHRRVRSGVILDRRFPEHLLQDQLEHLREVLVMRIVQDGADCAENLRSVEFPSEPLTLPLGPPARASLLPAAVARVAGNEIAVVTDSEPEVFLGVFHRPTRFQSCSRSALSTEI